MVRRKVISLIATAAMVLPVTFLGAFQTAPQLVQATTFHAPASAPAGDPEVLVQWFIRIDDLIACRTVTPDLRRIQHQYASQVRLVTYAVDADTALVRSFLRRERLARADVEAITQREFQETFASQLGPRAQTPSLLVSTGGTRMAFDVETRTVPGRRGAEEFSAYLGVLLQPIAVAGNNRSSSANGGQQ